MRTVITISLNGNAYQLDAVGFDALRSYLQVAEQRLAGNPDQEEIVADLEQAIADKCLRYLGPHKNVVSAGEITEVLREMGPVDGGAAEGQSPPGATGAGSAGGQGRAVPGAGATPGGNSWAGANGDAWSGSGSGIGGGTPGAAGAARLGAGLGAAGNEDAWAGGTAGAGGEAGAHANMGTGGAGAASGPAEAGSAAGPGSSTWSAGTANASGNPSSSTPPLRRLYLIREGAAIAGVCKGLAAYLNLDVSIVRILFIVLTILTGGVWMLIYLVMMFVIPYAQTSEQHAAAHGWPFNAEELIARAKAHYADFKNSSKWQRQQWRAQQRTWKSQNKQWKQQRREWERYGSTQGVPPPPPPPPWSGVQPPTPPNTSYANQVLTGVFGPLADLVGVVLFIAFLLALFALLTHHRFLGLPLPIEVPSWMGIIILIVVYQAIIAPLRRARYSAHYGVPFANGWWAVFGALIWIVFVLAIGYQVYLHWWQITDFLQSFTSTLHDVISPWHEALERKADSGI